VVRNGLPDALAGKAGELKAMGVSVYDFRIPRPDKPENETFHAKVVRVDEAECYAGSSNMTKWSFEYSLELGFHVRGAAAARVAKLLEAVIAVSVRVPL
jgi:phosphatidylserine/phosphatidylglycerophosphate/cardiolipin synthase-like enzyme